MTIFQLLYKKLLKIHLLFLKSYLKKMDFCAMKILNKKRSLLARFLGGNFKSKTIPYIQPELKDSPEKYQTHLLYSMVKYNKEISKYLQMNCGRTFNISFFLTNIINCVRLKFSSDFTLGLCE